MPGIESIKFTDETRYVEFSSHLKHIKGILEDRKWHPITELMERLYGYGKLPNQPFLGEDIEEFERIILFLGKKKYNIKETQIKLKR